MLEGPLRRVLLGATLFAGAGLVSAVTTPTPAPALADDPRARLRRKRLHNLPLLTQDGRTVRFYDDVVKDRKVVISVMYSGCSNICTPATRNLMEARERLGDWGRDIHFVSITLTPLSDTPAELRAYKKAHGIGADWTFLTGQPAHVEQVTRGLGLLSDNPADELLSHSGSAVIADEKLLKWGHGSTLTGGRALARMIRFELV